MRTLLFVLFSLVGCLFISSGCAVQHTPHVYNPIHLNTHLQKVFSPTYGECHRFHIDVDRVFFGLDNYEELENTEYVYSE